MKILVHPKCCGQYWARRYVIQCVRVRDFVKMKTQGREGTRAQGISNWVLVNHPNLDASNPNIHIYQSFFASPRPCVFALKNASITREAFEKENAKTRRRKGGKIV